MNWRLLLLLLLLRRRRLYDGGVGVLAADVTQHQMPSTAYRRQALTGLIRAGACAAQPRLVAAAVTAGRGGGGGGGKGSWSQLRRVTTMIFVVTVVFVVCWTPYHAVHFVDVYNHRRFWSLFVPLPSNDTAAGARCSSRRRIGPVSK